MSDDVFDQLVEDVLAGIEDEDEGTEEPTNEDEGSEAPAAEGGEEVLSLDDEDEESGPSASDVPINAESVGAAAAATVAAAAAEAEFASEADEEKPAPKKKKRPKAAADSAIDGKSIRPTLPLITVGEFIHPDYRLMGMLSVVSSRRVFSLSGLEESDAEERITSIEQELKADLRAQAAKRGAHALIGVSIQFQSGGDGLMVGFVSGTPIRLRKRPKDK